MASCKVKTAAVGFGVEGRVEEKMSRKAVSLFIYLHSNGDMKVDRNSLTCVERSELGWYHVIMFYKLKESAQQRQ